MGLDCLTLQFLRGDEPVVTQKKGGKKKRKRELLPPADGLYRYLSPSEGCDVYRTAGRIPSVSDRPTRDRPWFRCADCFGMPVGLPDLSSPASGSPSRRPTRRLFAVQNFSLIARFCPELDRPILSWVCGEHGGKANIYFFYRHADAIT